MLYLLFLIGLILVALSIVMCRIASSVYSELLRQRQDIERLRVELDGQWKGAGYLHAQTRALIEGQPPPNRKDYWN